MNVAVIGANGAAGSHTAAKLRHRGVDVVEISRSRGVDLISGRRLTDALSGVTVAVDASAAARPRSRAQVSAPQKVGLHEALTTATRNIVDACSAQNVAHLVFLWIAGIDDPAFDDFGYYVAKRAQQHVVAEGPVPSTTVKASQFHEFAANQVAVSVGGDGLDVQDWLIQPVAAEAEAVAAVLADTACGDTRAQIRTVTGPQVIRLPELTAKLLHIKAIAARSAPSRRRCRGSPTGISSPQATAPSSGQMSTPGCRPTAPTRLGSI